MLVTIMVFIWQKVSLTLIFLSVVKGTSDPWPYQCFEAHGNLILIEY